MLPDDERVAVGSLNYHTDFFGRAFAIAVDGSGPMHSVCVAFGLERWVHAFLVQHGDQPATLAGGRARGAGASRSGAGRMLNTTAVARSNRDSTRDVYLSEAEPGPRVAEIAALLRRSWRAPSLLYSERTSGGS